MTNLATLSENITSLAGGIWKTEHPEDISYTKDGHQHIKHVEHKSFWFEHRTRCLRTVLQHFPFSGPVLDVGGGNGSFSLWLQSEGLETVLLEPGTDGAENAHKAGVKHVINGSLLGAGFKEEAFAATVALDVMEHIEDHDQFVQEIHRIMQSTGRLLLTVPALPFLFSDFDREVGHFRRYTLSQLSHLLKAHGFEVEYQTYFFAMLPIPVFIFRKLLNRKSHMPGSNLKGHFQRNSITGHLLKPFLKLEAYLISKRVRLPIGTSCLIIVRKPK